jgi:hypothetical protein
MAGDAFHNTITLPNNLTLNKLGRKVMLCEKTVIIFYEITALSR